MAQNVQNVTLSLTLPITCHICLGKVRKPVICVNYHVFCSVCIEVWLRNNNQCPACRVPITPENPCKDIIGGTGENECVFTHTVRKHLRKTRLELLHKEYEDEIESLEKEVDELKAKNLSLESQLKIALDPQTLTAFSENEGIKENLDGENGAADSKTLEEWTKKLTASNEISVKIRDDLEKLKEVNKKLRTENCGFVRENMRLKAEVDSRSPQKFGRFTVAALQSKVDQHERETNQLKKALERSDEYIEELESQVAQLKRTVEEHKRCTKGDASSGKVNDSSKECTSLKIKPQDTTPTLRCASQSSDNLEQPSLSGLQDDSMMCLNSSSQDTSNGSDSLCPLDKEMFSSSQEDLVAATSTAIMNATLQQPWENKLEELMDGKGGNICAFPALDTPTMSLSSLQLNTPNEKSPSKSAKKCSTYLRKLTFDFPSETLIQDNSEYAENDNSSMHETSYVAKNKMFWNYSQTNPDKDTDFRHPEQNETVEPGKGTSISNDKACQFLFKRLQAISEAEINRARTSSEASMDAAYLDKISELDSMMSESENNKSPFRFRSAELANASKTSRSAKLKQPVKLLEQTKVKADRCSESSNVTSNSDEWKPITFSVMSPSSLQMNENFPLFADEPSDPEEIVPLKSCFTQEKDSSAFLFSEEGLKSESCFVRETDGDRPPWAASFVAEERSRSNSHSAKRKIQGSISSASPSKNLKN